MKDAILVFCRCLALFKVTPPLSVDVCLNVCVCETLQNTRPQVKAARSPEVNSLTLITIGSIWPSFSEHWLPKHELLQLENVTHKHTHSLSILLNLLLSHRTVRQVGVVRKCDLGVGGLADSWSIGGSESLAAAIRRVYFVHCFLLSSLGSCFL